VNVDSPLLDHHALDDGANQRLPVFERQRSKGLLDVPHKALEIRVQLGVLKRGGLLALQCLKTALHVCSSLAK
jgi:hypothetical protein